MTFKPNYVGYGIHKPKIIWPDNKQICISFVINYEEGGEMSILNGDIGSESYLCEIIGTDSLKGKRNLISESCYEYGSRAGIYRLLDLFKKYNIETTIYAVGKALELNPEICTLFKDHEVATHHYRWFNYRDVTEREEIKHIQQLNDIHDKLCGYKPKGMYVGSVSYKSINLVKKFDNFKYINDCYNDDIPYWFMDSDNISSTKDPLLVIPYTLVNNDMRYLLSNGYVSSDQFFTYLKDAFDVLYNEGGKMMSIGLHPRIIGHPGRLMGLIKFLEYIHQDKLKNKIWITKRENIYKYWKKNYPPKWQMKHYPSLLYSKL